jgi:hypothetical protein
MLMKRTMELLLYYILLCVYIDEEKTTRMYRNQ